MKQDTFSIDLSKFIAKTEGKAKLIIAKSFIDLSESIIRDTPKDTGRLKNNWFPSINSFSGSTSDSQSGNGQESSSRLPMVYKMKLGDTITLSNNLPYAVPIEYGHSKKSPAGMVRLNIAKWSVNIKNNAKAFN